MPPLLSQIGASAALATAHSLRAASVHPAKLLKQLAAVNLLSLAVCHDYCINPCCDLTGSPSRECNTCTNSTFAGDRRSPSNNWCRPGQPYYSEHERHGDMSDTAQCREHHRNMNPGGHNMNPGISMGAVFGHCIIFIFVAVVLVLASRTANDIEYGNLLAVATSVSLVFTFVAAIFIRLSHEVQIVVAFLALGLPVMVLLRGNYNTAQDGLALFFVLCAAELVRIAMLVACSMCACKLQALPPTATTATPPPPPVVQGRMHLSGTEMQMQPGVVVGVPVA